jgi:hypothetical protein
MRTATPVAEDGDRPSFVRLRAVAARKGGNDSAELPMFGKRDRSTFGARTQSSGGKEMNASVPTTRPIQGKPANRTLLESASS